MKKKQTIGLFLLFLVFLQFQCAERFVWTTVTANLFSHHDKNYKDIYGDFLFAPEIKFSLNLFSGFYAWSSVLYVPAKWELKAYNITAKSRQLFYSVGLGDQVRFSERIRGHFEIGVMLMQYREEVASEVQTGSDFGMRFNAGLNYRILDRLFACMTISYLKGASTIGDKEIQLGGLKSSIGFELVIAKKKQE